MDNQTALSTPAPVEAPKRTYAAPALVVHGDVQALTHGKEGTNADQDGGGSFTPIDN